MSPEESTFGAGHPARQTLQGYALKLLANVEVAAVEEHLLLCESCRQIVTESDEFALVVRDWGRRGPVAWFIHDTEEGPIHLEMRLLPDLQWAACFQGEKVEGRALFQSAEEAYRYLERVFSEMYPEHRCTDRCGARG